MTLEEEEEMHATAAVALESPENGASDLETPLLMRSHQDEQPQPLQRNTPPSSSSLRVQPSNSSQNNDSAVNFSPRFCARFSLGLLYLLIGLYMMFWLFVGRVLDQSVGTGLGLCHEATLCALFVSWGLVSCFMMLQGIVTMSRKSRRLSLVVMLSPLAILVLYLVMAYFYLKIRNHYFYDDEEEDDGDANQDNGDDPDD